MDAKYREMRYSSRLLHVLYTVFEIYISECTNNYLLHRYLFLTVQSRNVSAPSSWLECLTLKLYFVFPPADGQMSSHKYSFVRHKTAVTVWHTHTHTRTAAARLSVLILTLQSLISSEKTRWAVFSPSLLALCGGFSDVRKTRYGLKVKNQTQRLRVLISLNPSLHSLRSH